jgi:hypothetical protein
LRRSQLSPPPTSAVTTPFGFVVGQTLVAVVGHGVLGSTSSGNKELGFRLEDIGFGERLGAPDVFIYGIGEEIVAHIPRNLGSGKTLSTEPSSGHLGFKLSHIRFDWLKSGCVAVGLFFGSDTVWSELPDESSRNFSSK